jgi:hypothetical protein
MRDNPRHPAGFASMSGTERSRLNSWKEIAAYIGRDVRTALRWHKDRGLPVHRVPGGQGRSVFAYPHELDIWLEGGARATGEPVPDSTTAASTGSVRYRRTVVRWVAAAVALLAIAIGWGRHERGPLASVSIVDGDFAAIDDTGRARWRVPFPDGSAPLISPPGGIFEDLDGDRERDVLAAIQLHPRVGGSTETLYSIAANGTVRWTIQLEDRLSFRGGDYGPPWVTADLAVFTTGGARRIAWATHHDIWWPGIIAILDADGRILHRYVHAGWVTALEATPDGQHLLAAGVSNHHDGAVFIVLDAKSPGGTSPVPEESPYACLKCPSGRPVKYFVLPRSELSRIGGRALLEASIAILTDGSIVLRIPQDPVRRAAEAIYEFTPEYELRRASLGDVYWDWHNRLAAAGQIDHDADACPERGGLSILAWDSGRGWRQVKANSANTTARGADAE